MKKITINFIVSVVFSAASIASVANEYFVLTDMATPYKAQSSERTLLDGPKYTTSIITIKNGKLMLNQNNCSVDIDKIFPFHVDGILVDMIHDAGGSKNFNRFLKVKIHTDMRSWKTEYLVKFPDKDAGAAGCELIQRGIIYRSSKELIITDGTFFYRFILNKANSVEELVKSIKIKDSLTYD